MEYEEIERLIALVKAEIKKLKDMSEQQELFLELK